MIEIKQQNARLLILLNGQERLAFNIDEEIFAVGNGENSYSMSRGSFDIKEKILSKHPRKIVRFQIVDDGAYIILDAEDFALSLRETKFILFHKVSHNTIVCGSSSRPTLRKAFMARARFSRNSI